MLKAAQDPSAPTALNTQPPGDMGSSVRTQATGVRLPSLSLLRQPLCFDLLLRLRLGALRLPHLFLFRRLTENGGIIQGTGCRQGGRGEPL